MSIHVENKPWWGYLEDDLKESLKLSIHLADKSAKWKKTFHDYSFIVFPAAKAYEGFLKKYFWIWVLFQSMTTVVSTSE